MIDHLNAPYCVVTHVHQISRSFCLMRDMTITRGCGDVVDRLPSPPILQQLHPDNFFFQYVGKKEPRTRATGSTPHGFDSYPRCLNCLHLFKKDHPVLVCGCCDSALFCSDECMTYHRHYWDHGDRVQRFQDVLENRLEYFDHFVQIQKIRPGIVLDMFRAGEGHSDQTEGVFKILVNDYKPLSEHTTLDLRMFRTTSMELRKKAFDSVHC